MKVEQQDAPDRIFCNSVIRSADIIKIDFNVNHSLNKDAALYVEFFKNNQLKTVFDKMEQKKKERKPRKKKETTETI